MNGGRMDALQRADSVFRAELVGEPALVSRAPGRVNLIGEHVDYSDGYVLPVAIDREVVVLAAPTLDHELHVIAADAGQSIRFRANDKWLHGHGWQAYVRGTAQLLSDAGVRTHGANLVIAGDLPQGAGLSSSAALVVAVANALLGLAETPMPPMQLVELARRVELDFAGVSCGVMDPFASICGVEDHALFLDCRSLDYLLVRVPDHVRIIATDSGVRRSLYDTAYNDRVRETKDAARRLGVRTLRDVSPAMYAEDGGDLPDRLQRRARHVIHEIARTRTVADALEHGELDRVGALFAQSHASLRDDYEVSTPEIDALVEIAAEIPGVFGTRLSGAGFGGCTLSLVHEGAVEEFVARVPSEYHTRTDRTATVHVCDTANGASVSTYDM